MRKQTSIIASVLSLMILTPMLSGCCDDIKAMKPDFLAMQKLYQNIPSLETVNGTSKDTATRNSTWTRYWKNACNGVPNTEGLSVLSDKLPAHQKTAEEAVASACKKKDTQCESATRLLGAAKSIYTKTKAICKIVNSTEGVTGFGNMTLLNDSLTEVLDVFHGDLYTFGTLALQLECKDNSLTFSQLFPAETGRDSRESDRNSSFRDDLIPTAPLANPADEAAANAAI
jgi:hypothetical protein